MKLNEDSIYNWPNTLLFLLWSNTVCKSISIRCNQFTFKLSPTTACALFLHKTFQNLNFILLFTFSELKYILLPTQHERKMQALKEHHKEFHLEHNLT